MSGGQVTCPGRADDEDQHLPARRSQRELPARLCGGCPLKQQCCPGRARRQIRIGEHEELMQSARRALADPTTSEHLRRTRPRIERLLGVIAHRYGARKSRYIGTAKARLQVAWAAALANLNPISRQLAAQTA